MCTSWAQFPSVPIPSLTSTAKPILAPAPALYLSIFRFRPTASPHNISPLPCEPPYCQMDVILDDYHAFTTTSRLPRLCSGRSDDLWSNTPRRRTQASPVAITHHTKLLRHPTHNELPAHNKRLMRHIMSIHHYSSANNVSFLIQVSIARVNVVLDKSGPVDGRIQYVCAFALFDLVSWFYQTTAKFHNFL